MADEPTEKQEDVWRCPCGLTTITLPFKPLLLSICCLQPYYYVRTGSTKPRALTSASDTT